jgi:hypothetical protein
MVEKSALRSTQLVVGCETQTEEVERVGAVGLGSNVDGGVVVDVGCRAENNWRCRRVKGLTTNLSPVGNLADGESVRNGVFNSREGLISLGPERRHDSHAEGARNIELSVWKPVVSSDVPAHDCRKLVKASVGVYRIKTIYAGCLYYNFSCKRLKSTARNRS